ncbi:MAG: ABC transporter permease [Eubacteriales bacterium]|nr:ABC transporter permease [Eubacteriales bacterium]
MLLESLKMAFNSLIANKMRALLTMLGIIVGIGSVIAIVSLGEGGKNEIMSQFEQVGTSTVIIQVRSSKAQPDDYITQSDITAIKDRIDSVKYVTSSLQSSARAYTEMGRKNIVISAIDDDYNRFMPLEILYGRIFNEIEYSDALPVAIIDRIAARDLFGRENAVGEKMTIDREGRLIRVTVIGVCESVTSQFAGFAGNFADSSELSSMPVFVYSPVKTLRGIVDTEDKLSSIYVMASKPELVDEAGSSVIRMLELRKGNEQKQVYRSQNMTSILEQVDEIINIMTIFISAVAAISLLVGGIGVMNIMLVSVTERTREIGIRKAIGATTGDIMLQFITESVILTFVGGILGIMFGLGLSYAISGVVQRLDVGQITPYLKLSTILLVVAFSSSVGLFFGIYPARKAANLDPIEALRYE